MQMPQPLHFSDLVVLATAIELPQDATRLGQKLGLQFCGANFFRELHPKLGPVETATEGIFLAGCCQGPKDIPNTVAHAKAAASAAAAPLSQGQIRIEAIISEVHSEKCSGCGICIPLCPYHAITMQTYADRPRAQIEMSSCKGCGVCTSTCPSGAIVLHGYEESQIFAQIEALTA